MLACNVDKAAAADMRYFAVCKLSRSEVYKKILASYGK